MEGLDPKRIDLASGSLPLAEKKEVNGIRFSLTHNLPEKNYGGDLRPANATENFDQLLDDQTDMAIYGHIHKEVVSLYGQSGPADSNPGTHWHAIFRLENRPKTTELSMLLISDVEEGGVTNPHFVR